MPAITINIGGKPYEVPELTLFQMRRTAKIGTAIVRLQGQEQTDENIDAMFDGIVAIVQLWLGDKHAELTAEQIEKSMTQSEMQAVSSVINPALIASGIEPAGNVAGAAGAGANPPKA